MTITLSEKPGSGELGSHPGLSYTALVHRKIDWIVDIWGTEAGKERNRHVVVVAM